MLKSVLTDEYGIFMRQLIKARKLAGITQQDLAKGLGKPQSYISKYERGERRLDVVEFVRICHVLDINACSVLSKVEEALLTNSKLKDKVKR